MEKRDSNGNNGNRGGREARTIVCFSFPPPHLPLSSSSFVSFTFSFDGVNEVVRVAPSCLVGSSGTWRAGTARVFRTYDPFAGVHHRVTEACTVVCPGYVCDTAAVP